MEVIKPYFDALIFSPQSDYVYDVYEGRARDQGNGYDCGVHVL